MIPFIYHSKKSKLICSEIKLSDCLVMQEMRKGRKEGSIKKHEKTFAVNGYVHYLDYNGRFINIYIYQDVSDFTF